MAVLELRPAAGGGILKACRGKPLRHIDPTRMHPPMSMLYTILTLLGTLATSGVAASEAPGPNAAILPLPPVPGKQLPESKPSSEEPSQPTPPPPVPPTPAAPSTAAPVPPKPTDAVLKIVFTYGSEKQKWIETATQSFNAAHHALADGQRIEVEAIPVGSGDIVEEILTGRRQPHLVSPASGIFVDRGNAASREREQSDLFGEPSELVSSPMVVALWRDMAEKMGWPARELGWRDIFAFARDSEAWGKISQPEWGSFRLAHTLPDDSNSGLLAVCAETFAALESMKT